VYLLEWKVNGDNNNVIYECGLMCAWGERDRDKFLKNLTLIACNNNNNIVVLIIIIMTFLRNGRRRAALPYKKPKAIIIIITSKDNNVRVAVV
jgi:hypothetical protein